MMQRLITLAHKEIRGMHQAAYVLALLTFGAQILALVRDRLLAYMFGVGAELDLYYASFRIPDFLFVIFASALSVFVLIPFVAERMSRGSPESARMFLSQIFSFFCVIYVIVAIGIALFMPAIVPVVFPGFSLEEHTNIILLARILLLQPFILGVSGIFAVITQINHRFVLYALSPLLYNVGIIIGIVFLYPVLGVSGLVFGVIVGALLHAGVQIPSLLSERMVPSFVKIRDWSVIRSIIKESLPRVATLSLQQIILFSFISIATTLSVGSVSAFQFAFNLQSVPLAIIGASYSVAAFPLLAKKFAQGDMDTFRSEVSAGIRHVLFWSLPAITLLIVMRAQIVRVVLGSGAFDWNATRITAAVFAVFMISLVAQSLHLLLVRVWYASGNTRVPLIITSVTSAFIIIFAYILSSQFDMLRGFLVTILRLESVRGVELVALPLAYSIGITAGVIALAVATIRRFMLPTSRIIVALSRASIVAIAGGAVAYAMLNAVVSVFGTRVTLFGVFGQGMVAGVCGIVTVFVAYTMMRSPEMQEMVSALRRKLFRVKPVFGEDTPRD